MTRVPKPTARPRAVLYSRLSRATLESTALVGQSEDLDALAAREGWDVVATFVDEGLSGGKRRANADEALRMLRENEADVLAAYAVDRFSRMGIGEDAEVIRTIEAREAQAQRGITPPPLVYFAREGIRSDAGSDWRLRYALSSEMARGERDVMVSRRRRSVAQLQSLGRFTGRGPAPWGYRATDNPNGPGRILVPDPAEAEVAREMADRLIAGESGSSVARDLVRRAVPAPRSGARLALLRGDDATGLPTGLWSSASVAQMMQSQHLLGRILQNTSRSGTGGTRAGTPVLGQDGRPLQAFEPVLSLTTFLALQDRFSLGMGKGRYRQRRAARLGSGLVYCGDCGAKCYVSSSRQYIAYRCSNAARGALTTCRGRKVSADIVEAAMVEAYLAGRGDLQAIEYVERRTGADIESRVASLTDRIRSLGAEITAPGADVLSISRDLAALQAERDDVLATPSQIVAEAVTLDGTWAEIWAAADLVDQRRWLGAVFERFDIYGPTASQRVVPVPVEDDARNHQPGKVTPGDPNRFLADGGERRVPRRERAE